MFYIDRETEITTDLLSKMLVKFNTERRPKLQKWYDYYSGNHAILQKQYKDTSKVCNRIVTNYCSVIAQEFAGYIAGQPVSYHSEEDIEDIQEVIDANDDSQDIDWLTNALIFGSGVELYWLNSEAQVRYSQINPLNCFIIYSNDLEQEILAAVRWYDRSNIDDDDTVIVELYDKDKKTVFKCIGLGGELSFLEEEYHYFKDVPVSVFHLNGTDESIFNGIITLQDAYNELQSCEIDEFSQWADAYLALTNVDAERDDIASMKEQRVLCLPEGATASWLVKNASDTQIENMLLNVRKNIFKIANAPDLSDENFMAQSGVAIQYKLVGFENAASAIVARFTKAIQRRLRLICNILNIKASDVIAREVSVTFTRNLPVNTAEIAQLVPMLKNVVSDRTLLAQIPWVDDPEAELEAVHEQKVTNSAINYIGSPNSFYPEEDEL